MLSVKKVLAGRGAVDYYLAQTQRGLADYYLPDPALTAEHDAAGERLAAPGSAWWGGGAGELELVGEVERAAFVPLYAKGTRPDGGYLGRRFRTQEQAAAARAEALAEAGSILDPYDRWEAEHEIRRGRGKASVAAWDCTFSPVKSVSLLWASGDRTVQQQVWAAQMAAVDAGVDAGLAYLQEHAGYVRAGRNGVRTLESSGLVVARMNEWSSRTGDMQLHTHCLVLNRARTVEDGNWRALDGRAILAVRTGAGAIYNRVLEGELTRRLGVAWRDRPDGLREIDGIDDGLIEAFSTRRRAITTQLAGLVAAYEDTYGVPPPPAVVSAMAQDATLTTRPGKHDLDPADALAQWETTARARGRQLADLPARVLGRAAPGASAPDDEVRPERLLERLAESGRATFARHDLLRAALDVVEVGASDAHELRAAAERLVDATLVRPELLSVTTPDPITVPGEFARSDGASSYDRPGRQRWALRKTLDQEAWLLQVTAETRRHAVDAARISQAGGAHGLGDAQWRAVHELLEDPRRVGLLVGPAGAGKTSTLRAVVDAWQRDGHEVLGLAVSQAAAEVLGTEAHVRAENTAKWLHETQRGRWNLPAGVLVIVDEASMVATDQLVDIVEQARQVDGKVLLVGDPAQLSAIDVGGSFELLAERHGAAHLHEIRRFTHQWERDATLELRRRNPDAIAAYAMRGRLHGGPTASIETELFDAWQADALGAHAAADRPTVLMIVATNDQAAAMGQRARHALLEAGRIDSGPTVTLRDNVASVGDHVVTRRNDRTLVTSTGSWVVNGDVWTVAAVHDDGAASLRRHSDDATITLPPAYLAAHTHLGYATTAHRAQGMTVDVAHALITTGTTHQQLYVAATRGRNANHLWAAIDSDRDLIADNTDLPTPEQILAGICARRDPDRAAAHQAILDSQTGISSLARLGAIYDDAIRRATHTWANDLFTNRGLHGLTDEPAWPSLLERMRQLALAGHDVENFIDTTLTQRDVHDAESVAALLHWRLGTAAEDLATGHPSRPLAEIPPIASPVAEVARQAAELIRQRLHALREELDTGPAPGWARTLGARPADEADARAWLSAVTAIAGYRERYEVADHVKLLGPRPAALRPDAQAAWDHAQHLTDEHLARHLHHLDDHTLAELDARQQAIIAVRPRFDPNELQQAHRTLELLPRRSRADADEPRAARQLRAAERHVARLEESAQLHRGWADAAGKATGLRRQLAMVAASRAGQRSERLRRDDGPSRTPRR